MKYFLLGIVAGILITLLAQFGWQRWKMHGSNEDIALLEAGKLIVERSIKDAKVLDVVLIPNYKKSVNYVYDKMYGVEVKYVKDGKVKKIIFPLSKYKQALISPDNTELFLLDKNAKILNQK